MSRHRRAGRAGDPAPPGPEALAAIHAESIAVPPPWSAGAFAALLANPQVHLHAVPGGFALGRTAAGESELLTIAVRPDARCRGAGGALLRAYLAEARHRGAAAAFLEVAETNAAARALYAGWSEAGRRPGYYGGADALVLTLVLT